MSFMILKFRDGKWWGESVDLEEAHAQRSDGQAHKARAGGW